AAAGAYSGAGAGSQSLIAGITVTTNAGLQAGVFLERKSDEGSLINELARMNRISALRNEAMLKDLRAAMVPFDYSAMLRDFRAAMADLVPLPAQATIE